MPGNFYHPKGAAHAMTKPGNKAYNTRGLFHGKKTTAAAIASTTTAPMHGLELNKGPLTFMLVGKKGFHYSHFILHCARDFLKKRPLLVYVHF